MKHIIAKLVATTNDQRFYELSAPIHKGRRFGNDVDIAEELQLCKEEWLKSECKHLIRTDGCHIICVSDAHTHIERLVFVAEKLPSGYGNLGIQIDGCHTMRINGGDSDKVYADEVYLRHLAVVNGVQIVLNTRNSMNETLEQQIKRLGFCRDCIVLDYDAGKEEYNRLEQMIEELKQLKSNE